MVAGEQGADYVAFGDLGERPGPAVYDLLRWWSELFVLPCLAEVATTVEDCPGLARAGADLVAAGAGVWTDPEGAAAAVRRLRAALQAA
jgi:thiamine-phosphate pyrophosphorylase